MTPRATEASRSIGVGWIGPFPATWKIVRLKHLARLYAGGTPDRENKAYWDNGTIAWLNSGAVNQWSIDTPSELITEEGLRNSSAKWIPKGALVMALAGQGKTKGMVAQLGIETTCNQSMAAIVPSEENCSKYLLWWLDANYETIRNLAGGEQRDGLNLEIVGNLPCPIPAKAVQDAIADYLDHETGRLDALVVAKERLLELLTEKRRALITRAVTKGLNPKASLRDSRVPWLGEIPAHWEIRRLRFFCQSIQTGRTPSQEYMDCAENDPETIDWFTPGDFGESLVLRDSIRKVAVGADHCGEISVFAPGTVFVVGIGATLGRVGFIQRAASANQQINALVPQPDVTGELLAYALSILDDVMYAMANSATLPILNQQRMGDLPIALPHMDEQRAIVARIAAETTKLDALRAATERTIALLKERRATLIAAAVTGQIDVGV